MARWRSSVLVLVLAAGCAFTDGEPWGEVRPALRVVFDPSPERLTPEGWLRTTLGYGVELHALDVSVDGLTLSMAAGGEGAAVFDPADPPEGYSLCHNGHCHAASGALVSYEAIAAELGGGGTTEGFVLAVPAAGSVPAASGGGDVPLG
ncbi:MAG: hypothetical protein FJ098_17105, partial [Deltaproteobacteria bacterium]|nr:hypothetical protein [Deltaproteobacteria bacterium]